jgi:hypothetical protein
MDIVGAAADDAGVIDAAPGAGDDAAGVTAAVDGPPAVEDALSSVELVDGGDMLIPQPERSNPHRANAVIGRASQICRDPLRCARILSADMVLSSCALSGSLIFRACRLTAGLVIPRGG